MRGPAASRPDGALRRVARGGLCGGCAHARLVESARGSLFLRCVHPDTPKYPPQPLVACAAFAPSDGAGEG